MRREIDNIEIQEPPLEEIKKKRSCLKHTCSTGCGCIILFIIGILLFFKFVIISKPKELKSLPINFPNEIPVYDKDAITKISFISGRQKNRMLETAAYVPKFLLSPLAYLAGNETNSTSTPSVYNSGLSEIVRFIKEPVLDHRDIIQIEWASLAADPKFIIEYYQKELMKKGFDSDITSETQSVRQIKFSKEKIDGVIYSRDNNLVQGTDFLSMTVSVPPQ
jgi:hypothetical protein